MEKNLGIHNSQRKLTRKERFALMEENIKAGKQKQEEMKEVRRLQEEKAKEQEMSQQISSKATEFMLQGMTYSDAYEKAKKLYIQK
jgi:hypothetical protein